MSPKSEQTICDNLSTEKSFLLDAEASPALTLRIFQRKIAMKILLRMRRASLTKAMSITIQPAPTTEPTPVMITLSSKITKQQTRPETENRPSILGVGRRSQLVEGRTSIILRRYKYTSFLRRSQIPSSIFCVKNRHIDVIYCT